MPTWSCGHSRRAVTGYLGTARDEQLLRFAVENGVPHWSDAATEEARQRGQQCPACRNQSRRLRRGWAALVVVAALLLLVAWRSY